MRSRSKADQDGAGQEVTIANSRHGPLGNALLTWLHMSGVRSGPLFRRVKRCEVADEPLPAAALTNLVKSRLKALGIDPSEFGAHSLRAGFVTSAALHGIPLWRIKRHTRHSRETMVETYVRDEEGSARMRLPWERARKSGNIRDADDLARMRYPVWATSIHPAHPEKKSAGEVNVTVSCDGVTVEPGDLVVADGDGVIVIPRAMAAAAVAATRKRTGEEKLATQQIAAGATLWDLHRLGERYSALGVPEIEP